MKTKKRRIVLPTSYQGSEPTTFLDTQIMHERMPLITEEAKRAGKERLKEQKKKLGRAIPEIGMVKRMEAVEEEEEKEEEEKEEKEEGGGGGRE